MQLRRGKSGSQSATKKRRYTWRVSAFQRLISLPSAMALRFVELEERFPPEWVASCDPGKPLGSGGGTAHLLHTAWLSDPKEISFRDWLQQEPKVVIHSGGQSRRLPAYSTVGKALMPMPVERGSIGQRFDQNLLDLQIAEVERILDLAGPHYVVAILSGDVLLRPRNLPRKLPLCDVLCLGFESSAEEAQNFGTFFCRHGESGRVDLVLQKPQPAQVDALTTSHEFLVDSGVWLLSLPAVMSLMNLCGWDEKHERFDAGPQEFDLYSQFGLSLGSHPTHFRSETNGLVTRVVGVGREFYHFGTNRQLLESITRLQTVSTPRHSDLGFTSAAKRRTHQHALNTVFESIPEFLHESKVWFENCYIPTGSEFLGDNIITNVPPLAFPIKLPFGAALDMVPVDDEKWCIRTYGFDDRFTGPLDDPHTKWRGEAAREWFMRRGLTAETPNLDVQFARIFPIADLEDLNPELIDWLVNCRPDENRNLSRWWNKAEKLSAAELQARVHLGRLYQQRNRFRNQSLETTLLNQSRSVFFSIDLEDAAKKLASTSMKSNAHPLGPESTAAQVIHERMFRSELLLLRTESGAENLESEAFLALRNVIVQATGLKCDPPQSTILPDQIVWGRCPLRMDLAGGWTDTPPYSILNGGKVVNVAIEINGQPPVQVFGRVTKERGITLRSIDLGTELRIETFDDLQADVGARSEFALAKAALALSGFSPEFVLASENSLTHQLEAFGGGLGLTMLAAVPKGSGLGTSSILSGAILGTLSEICGHRWTQQQIFDRVTASEQILTTGGGWQDQVGGLLPGIKLATTEPGIKQRIVSNWLPDFIFTEAIREGTALLYYTGITRLAKDVLREIVRGMFLNSYPRLKTLKKIGENTESVVEALQRRDYDALGSAVKISWQLNQELDLGTCPPAVAKVYHSIQDHIFGAKLLGAGGGGFMLILCKDVSAASRVRQILNSAEHPCGARFVAVKVSQTGFELSKS